MSIRRRVSFCLMLGALSLPILSGCNSGPNPYVRQAQLQARAQWDKNQTLTAQKQAAEQQATQMAAELQTANSRLANLDAERSELHERYASLLSQATNPLSGDATRKFEELSRKYPEFDFDPATGVSKFHADVLFDTGKDELKPTAQNVLKEFADLMNSQDASRFHILVVGHTDDQPIKKTSTHSKHETNWHLSTDRADAVVMALSKFGVKQSRMGAAGYSMFQPVEANANDLSRQRNRRVEIFILAPEASVAGWDPGTSIN
jgi:chemotaxis protein MotB